MVPENQLNTTLINDLRIVEQDYTFRIILKFWKKESKNTQITLSAFDCDSSDKFVKAIKKRFEIKRYFCLEEIWVLQVRTPQEKQLKWVKDVNGRIKLSVSDTLKDLLMKRGQESGTRHFEDPLYEIEV